jgi:hypothetical protein
VVRRSVLGRLVGGLLLSLALVVALGGPTATGAAAQAQATTIINLESPASNAPVSTRMMVAGWAADPSGRDSGVDRVRVYLGDPNADGQELGAATYGQPRPDVARTLGDARFTNSGFQLAVELPPGDYTLTVYAHKNTAGPDEGWVVYSSTFTASASVRADPRATALLGGEQPQVRTAAPGSAPLDPASGTAGSGNSRIVGGSALATSPDGTAIRTTVSRNDPIPLDPIVPGLTAGVGAGRGDIELSDATGSGSGIRQSVISEPVSGASSTRDGQYRTGSVSMTGGTNTSCPGPNCPSNTQQVNQAMQNLPPNLVRDLIGYNIPGLGNSQACLPGASQQTNGCNPQTGSSIQAGAPSGVQQVQNQTAAAWQQSANQPGLQPAVPTGPQCNTYGQNGQCAATAGSQGPLGSTCLRWQGSQCSYYGQAPPQAATGQGQNANRTGTQNNGLLGLAGPQATQNPLLGTTSPLAAAGGTGCAQWGGNGQCMTPAATGGATAQNPYAALTNPGALTNPTGQTATTGGQLNLSNLPPNFFQPSSVATGGTSTLTQTAATGVSSLPASVTSPSGTAPTTSPYGAVPAPGTTGGACAAPDVYGVCR